MNRRDAIRAVMAMPAVASISVAKLEPDDVIVIECPGPLSEEGAVIIRKGMEEYFKGRQVIVLTSGLHMKVLKANA